MSSTTLRLTKILRPKLEASWRLNGRPQGLTCSSTASCARSGRRGNPRYDRSPRGDCSDRHLRGSRPALAALRPRARPRALRVAPLRRARSADDRHHRRRVLPDAARAVERRRDEPRRAGRRRPRRCRGVPTPLWPRQAAPAALPALPRPSAARRPRPVVTHARRRHARPRPVHPGDRRTRAVLGALRGVRRRHARRRLGTTPEPADRPRPARDVAGRHLDADVLDRAGRALRRLLPAELVPRRRAARPGHAPTAERDRLLHDRRADRRQLRPVHGVAAPHHLAGARARGVQRQPADALHALGRARGGRERLRPLGPREGHPRDTSSSDATSCAARCPRS